MTKTVLLCGVGGQGTILAAHILADVALANDLDVKVSEIHGMSQRGGAVTTVVRFGEDVKSMVCDKASADIVVSFEVLEALRNLEMLKPDGLMISADDIIKPASVLTGKASIPHDVCDRLKGTGACIIPSTSLAKEAGNTKSANVVLLGALCAQLDFPVDSWIESISNHVPPKTIDVNLAAFQAGRSFVVEHKG